jgi:hypothetical protein
MKIEADRDALRAQLAAMTTERDALRLRCHELLEVERLATEHDSGAYDSAKCIKGLMAQLRDSRK